MIFDNPVRVHRGAADFSGLRELVHGRKAAVITTRGALERGLVSLNALGIHAPRVVSDVKANPTVQSIQENASELLDGSFVPEVLIAIGGGSAMDSAKGIAAIASPGCSPEWFSHHLRDGAPFPGAFAPPAIIAIPTTAGTGSEVTMWGTVWDEVTGAKYSISHRELYPEHAVLIAELTLTLPEDLTLYTALDALSHCMESIWNKRANAVSDAFAAAGISRVIRWLPALRRQPADLEIRRNLQDAALLGGLAISCTATALAHSISYPLTSRFGMPHGLACSFTLPELVRFNGETAPERIAVISDAIHADNVNATSVSLSRFFADVGVAAHVRKYLDEDKATAMREHLLTPGRADNNVRPATHDDALRIVLHSL
jgi:phosphonate metabolism-associated iron-containing alcohol dehydrogenase